MDLDLILYLPEPLDRPPQDGDGAERAPSATDQGSPPPHPDLLTRAWVALPLLELAPKLELPPHGQPLADLATTFDGPGGIPEAVLTADLRARYLE
jgi:7,8-dihydro-6-hydroxymethylpterin-pyrophosphokinase